MPKHIKISKHIDTLRFYVSDVCEFASVGVSALFLLPYELFHAWMCFQCRNW